VYRGVPSGGTARSPSGGFEGPSTCRARTSRPDCGTTPTPWSTPSQGAPTSYALDPEGAPGGLEQYLPESLAGTLIAGFPFFGGVFALMLGVFALGSEYGWDTLKTLFTQRPGRLRVLAAKLAALGIVLVPFVLALFAAGAVTSYVIAQIERARDLAIRLAARAGDNGGLADPGGLGGARRAARHRHARDLARESSGPRSFAGPFVDSVQALPCSPPSSPGSPHSPGCCSDAATSRDVSAIAVPQPATTHDRTR
jgi:hypothetical protein